MRTVFASLLLRECLHPGALASAQGGVHGGCCQAEGCRGIIIIIITIIIIIIIIIIVIIVIIIIPIILIIMNISSFVAPIFSTFEISASS
jgi:hypothetical protein